MLCIELLLNLESALRILFGKWGVLSVRFLFFEATQTALHACTREKGGNRACVCVKSSLFLLGLPFLSKGSYSLVSQAHTHSLFPVLHSLSQMLSHVSFATSKNAYTWGFFSLGSVLKKFRQLIRGMWGLLLLLYYTHICTAARRNMNCLLDNKEALFSLGIGLQHVS